MLPEMVGPLKTLFETPSLLRKASRRKVSAAVLAAGLCCTASAKPTPRPFHCGTQVCDARTSYCEIIATDVKSIPNVYACRALPAACVAASARRAGCDCFPENTRCSFCSVLHPDGVSYLERTCFGGGAGNWHLPGVKK